MRIGLQRGDGVGSDVAQLAVAIVAMVHRATNCVATNFPRTV